MKATELRIGNLVKVWRFTKHNEPKELIEYPVEQIGKDENLNDYYVVVGGGFAVNVSTGIQPIPLTEEWLLRFGFYRKDENFCIETDEGWSTLCFAEDFSYSIHANERDYMNGTYPCFKTDSCIHVHQLQNLYFALTGEELKYTP